MASTRCRWLVGVAAAVVLALACAGIARVGLVRGVEDGAVAETRASADSPAAESLPASEMPGSAWAGEDGGPSTPAAPDSVSLPLPEELRGLSDAPADVRSRDVSLGIVSAAEEELERYRSQEGAVLARAGWLDLLGRTWGCVVSGPGWVEVCVVSEVGPGASRVEVTRMEAQRWERAYAGE